MRTEAEQIILTGDDLVDIYGLFLKAKNEKKLNKVNFWEGDIITRCFENYFSNETESYEYRGFMNPSAPLFEKIKRDPNYLLINNFAVDILGHPEKCLAPMGYSEVWKVSLFYLIS